MGEQQRNGKSSARTSRVSSLHLENWKNFTEVSVALQRRAFLVGPNASGKSNFLDVFRFLRKIVSIGGGFQEAVRERGGVSKLRALSARRYPDILIRLQAGDDDRANWEYELRFNQDNQRRPIVKVERVAKAGKELLRRPNEDDTKDPERLTQTYLEQINVNREFRELANFLESIRYLHIVPQLIREPERSVGRQNDPYGGDFLEQIAMTQENVQRARLRRIRDALRVAVPQLTDLEMWRDVRGTPHLRGNYEHWRSQGAWQTEEQFSDGTLRLLGLLWAVLDGSGPLLLEEPELSLHPEVVRFLPQLFARTQGRSGRQIIVSTHSLDLFRDEGISADEVLLLSPHGEGTRVTPASELADIQTLLDSGANLADVILPRTRPQKAHQIALFASA